MRHRTYSELRTYDTFEERFEYLALYGEVGAEVFGSHRWVNQDFYRSRQWRNVRNFVVVRDNGCDLAIPGYPAGRDPLVHHINPMTPEDIINGEEWVLDPEFLILTTKRTHNAIHYGDSSLIPKQHIARQAGDTKLW